MALDDLLTAMERRSAEGVPRVPAQNTAIESPALKVGADETAAASAEDNGLRTCHQCAHLTGGAVCRIAAPDSVVAARRGYRPSAVIAGTPGRCMGYQPKPEDTDRRPGRERWAGWRIVK